MAIVSLLLGQGQKGTRIDRFIRSPGPVTADGQAPGLTASIILDATISEDFDQPIEVTTHPVEKGVDISDHVILRPKTLKIEGKISETPFSTSAQIAGVATSVAAKIGQNLGGALGGAVGSFGISKTLAGVLKPKAASGTLDKNGKFTAKDTTSLGGDNPRIRDAMTEFGLIRDGKQAITIVTGLQQYKDYILTKFKVSRDTSSGGSINVSLEFQELQIAESENVVVRIPAIRGALGNQNQGKKKADPLSGQTDNKASLLMQGARSLKSGISSLIPASLLP